MSVEWFLEAFHPHSPLTLSLHLTTSLPLTASPPPLANLHYTQPPMPCDRSSDGITYCAGDSRIGCIWATRWAPEINRKHILGSIVERLVASDLSRKHFGQPNWVHTQRSLKTSSSDTNISLTITNGFDQEGSTSVQRTHVRWFVKQLCVYFCY